MSREDQFPISALIFDVTKSGSPCLVPVLEEYHHSSVIPSAAIGSVVAAGEWVEYWPRRDGLVGVQPGTFCVAAANKRSCRLNF